MEYNKENNLGRNSVSIEKCGERVTAPMKRTTFGCLSLNMISTCEPTSKN